MQIAADTAKSQSLPSTKLSEFSVTVRQSQSAQPRVIRCNGAVVSFELSKIPVAATGVFLAVNGVHGAASAELPQQIVDDAIGNTRALGCPARIAPTCQPVGPIG
jgi:ribonucleoside-diphosphate reductase alpha chain